MDDLNLVGKTIDHFEILEELGRGGMGAVYKAHQTNLDRVVALKVLPPALTFDQSYVARFQQEARSAARLEHKHIVPIYEIGSVDGLHYIAMKHIEGQTLRNLILKSGPMPVEQVIRLLDQMAEALDYAHSRGIIHRDIKPSNIMITQDGWVYLTDFGLARGSSGSGLTMAGTIMGTPEYMSPEQARGEDVKAPSDLYSLGIVLYEMLTGKLPFSGASPTAVLMARLMQPPQPPSDYLPTLPRAVEDVVMRALARDPQMRYGSAREMVEALTTASAQAAFPQPSVVAHSPYPGSAGATTAPLPNPLPISPPYGSPPPGYSPPYGAQPPSPPYGSPPPGYSPPYGAQPPSPPYGSPPPGYSPPYGAQPPSPPYGSQQPGYSPPYGAHSAQPAAKGRLPLMIGAAALVLGLVAITAFIVLRPSPAEQALDHLEKAQAAFERRGGFDEALAETQEAIKLDPRNVEAHTFLAMLYQLRGQHEQVVIAAQKALDIDPNYAPAHAWMAQGLLESKDTLEEALKYADQAVTLDPQLSLGYSSRALVLSYQAIVDYRPDLLDQAERDADKAIALADDESRFNQSEAHADKGSVLSSRFTLTNDRSLIQRAIEEYQRAIGLQDHVALLHSNLGYFYIDLKRYDDARKAFSAALERDATYWPGYDGLGWVLNAQRSYDEAIEQFNKVIELDPQGAAGYYGRAISHWDRAYIAGYNWQTELEAARDDLRKAIEARPNDALYWLYLGYILQSLDDPGANDALQQAIAIAEQDLKRNADNAFAHSLIGETQLALGDYAEAIESLEWAVELNPNHANAFYNLGRAYQSNFDYQRAIEAFAQAARLDPESARFKQALGQAYFENDELEQALDVLNEAIALDPGDAQSYTTLGRTYFRLGEYDSAIDAFSKAIEINPNDPDLHNWLGLSYLDIGEFEHAVDAFRASIDLAPDDPVLHYNLGRASYDLGEYDSAVDAFSASIERDSQNPDAQYWLGRTYYGQDNYDPALQAIDNAIALSPNEALYHYYRGLITSALGDSQAAIDAYNKAIETDIYGDILPLAYVELGNEYVITGEYDRAIDAYSAAINLNSSDSNAYAGLGHAYLQQGSYDQAIATLNSAIELNPEDVDAYNRLGLAYAYTHQYDRAIAAFQQAIALAPADPVLYFNLGRTYHEQANYSAAIEAYDQAIALDGSDGTLYRWKAEAEFQQGSVEAACRTIHDGLAVEPDLDELQEARSSFGCN
ncbi:MAG: hypothetical protein KatS3mg057_3136 [Herpetosiphonaceae bacterium]|nr:MAG: hypothetical protein KatS3mg057_3136 [Herpetosiphonaceae bacterium]